MLIIDISYLWSMYQILKLFIYFNFSNENKFKIKNWKSPSFRFHLSSIHLEFQGKPQQHQEQRNELFHGTFPDIGCCMCWWMRWKWSTWILDVLHRPPSYKGGLRPEFLMRDTFIHSFAFIHLFIHIHSCQSSSFRVSSKNFKRIPFQVGLIN